MRASNVVNATGVWADRLRPGELHDEAEVPRIRPSRGTHITLRHEDLPLVGGGAIVPAGGGRSIFALPWLGRTLLGTTDNDYEGDLDGTHHVPPSERGRRRTCSTRRTSTSAPRCGAADLTGAYAGRAAADHVGRSEEVRRHLAQGRALRDLERDGDDHRRQADDVAADGEDDRRPARRARGARRAVPHRTRSRSGRRSPAPTCRGSRACRRRPTTALAGRYGHAAHDVLAVGARARRAGRADRRRAARPARRGRLRRPPRAGAHDRRRAAAPHPAGAARRARSARRRARSWRASRAALAAELGWVDGESRAELAAWSAEARAEGVVGSA